MALIKIFRDGTFEAAHVEAVAATPGDALRHKLTEAKEKVKALTSDHLNANKIDALRATRERVQQAHKAKGNATPNSIAAHKARIEKINGTIKTLTSKMSGGKYVKPAVLEVRLKKIRAVTAKYASSAKMQNVSTRVPRVIDPASKFDREAKRTAGAVNRGIRTQLRDHAKTAMVPVSNRPGTTAPRAVPSSKKADTATKHTTKPSRGAIGNTLAEIKKIKASIATGTLKGAKLVRAREDLEKQRAALRELRAGKTTKNQSHVVKPGTAKHMGGAKKIAGKTSGMGDASKAAKSGTVASLTEKVARLRERIKTSVNAGQKATMKRLLTQAKEQLAAVKKAK